MAEGAALKKRLGAADRARVSDYLDSVREVEQRVQRLATSKSSQMDLPNAPQGVPDEFGEQLDALFDMIALAWQANQTRVASIHDRQGGEHAHLPEPADHRCLPSAVASRERSRPRSSG